MTGMEIVVHRGGSDLAPENTMAAAEACADLGIEFIEIDVWQSQDGVHYIMHDATLDRTTNGHGPIAERSSGYIDSLDAGSWFSPEFEDQTVPRLDRFLDWARDKVGVFFDVKAGDLGRIVRMIRDRGMDDGVFFWFNSDEHAREFRRIAPDISLKMNSRDSDEVRKHYAEYNNQIVEQGPNEKSAAVVRACHDLGIRVMATVFGSTARSNGLAEVYRQIVDLGYDMVNLDNPEPFIDFLREKGLR